MLENCGISGGTTITAYNRNRPSAISALTVFQNSTLTTGTALETVFIGGGAVAANEPIGALSDGLGWILTPSTRYALKATNLHNGATYLSLWIVWSED